MTLKAFDVHVGAKYRAVIPRARRAALQLEPGDRLMFLVDGEKVTLRVRPDSFTNALRGLHRELWPEDPGAWLEEERNALKY